MKKIVRNFSRIESLESRQLLAVAITGVVFYDRNYNTTHDSVEGGVPASVTAFIDLNENRILDTDEPSAIMPATSEWGPASTYTFTGLATDRTYYVVGLVLPTNYKQTTQISTGGSVQVSLSQGDTGVYAAPEIGIVVKPLVGSIAGQLYLDKDASGSLTAGDGFGTYGTVFIDKNNNAVMDSNDTVAAINNNVGEFAFTGLSPGTYTIRASGGYHSVLIPASQTRTVYIGTNEYSTGLEFGFQYPAMSAAIYTYVDTNSNSAYDSGEPSPSKGVAVYADINNNGLREETEPVVQGMSGYSAIAGLPNGTYKLRGLGGTNYTPTSDGISITLPYTTSAPIVRLGFVQSSTVAYVAGKIYRDLNNNGVQDTGEYGITPTSGSPFVYIDANGNSVFDSGEATSPISSSGSYTLGGTPGTTAILRVSYPASIYAQTAASIASRTVTFSGGSTITGLDFGLLPLGIVTGTVFSDINFNGTQDAGESGIASTSGTPFVYIDADNDRLFDVGESFSVLDSPGNYTLSGMPGTKIVIRVSYPTTSYTQASTAVTARSMTLSAGSTFTNQDFGLTPLGSVTGTIFKDLNGNGVQDAGEPGIGQSALQLPFVYVDVNDNGVWEGGEPVPILDSIGNFKISGMVGTTVVLRASYSTRGYKVSTPANNARTIIFTAGTAIKDQHFGLLPLGFIRGAAWNDINSNSAIDTAEARLPDRTVFVDANNNGALDAGESSAITTANGDYSIDALAAGTYLLRQVMPSGWSQTFPTANAGLSVTLANGQALTGKNFGSQLIPTYTASIAGNLWNDANANGAVDAGEAVLASRTVFIDANNNSTLDAGEVSKVTDASGNYSFTSLAAGTYSIRQVLPSGWAQTFPTANAGQSVTVAAGQVVTGKNFGSRIPPTASIAGTLWTDTNSNGAIDTGEAVLSGRTVFVDANNNSTLDTGEKTATTSSTGVYTFTALAAGTFLLRQVIPTGWAQTFPTANAGQSVTLTNGQVVTGKNFGSKTTTVVTGGSIAGYLWSDSNANGTKESTEPFTTAREVYLDTNKNGIKDTGEKSVLSDASGNYKFSNLSPGTYRVRRNALPAGYRYTSPTAGYHDVTITSGLNVTAKNIGVTDMAQVNGTVFNDANANKLKETTEAGLSGWKVFVDANNNGLWESTEKYATTSSTGLFSLNLIAGTYNLRLQSQTGKTITTPANGLATVTLAKAQVKSGLLFGVK